MFVETTQKPDSQTASCRFWETDHVTRKWLREGVEPFKALNSAWNVKYEECSQPEGVEQKLDRSANCSGEKSLNWGFAENFMQLQARCNSATSPTPSTKQKQPRNDSLKKKKTCSKSVQRKYIWDLHLKVHYGYIHAPHPYIIFTSRLHSNPNIKKHKTEFWNRDHIKHPLLFFFLYKIRSYCTSTFDLSICSWLYSKLQQTKIINCYCDRELRIIRRGNDSPVITSAVEVGLNKPYFEWHCKYEKNKIKKITCGHGHKPKLSYILTQ